jgi:hypothetical protein
MEPRGDEPKPEEEEVDELDELVLSLAESRLKWSFWSRPQSDPTAAALLRLSMEGVGDAIISPDFCLTITTTANDLTGSVAVNKIVKLFPETFLDEKTSWHHVTSTL